MRRPLRSTLPALAGALATTLAFAGCLAEPTAPAEVRCSYAGASYRAGERFAATDGCNSCSCEENGRIACTLIGCVAPGCLVGGRRYATGESFPSSDGCNTCTCMPAGVACTERACFDAGSDASADAPADAPRACSYGGSTYPDGATFPATDGCNTCACTAGSVACTKKACVDAGDAGNDAGYTCPPDGTINCQPAVPPALAPLCSGPQHDFIVAKCPGVRFVY